MLAAISEMLRLVSSTLWAKACELPDTCWMLAAISSMAVLVSSAADA